MGKGRQEPRGRFGSLSRSLCRQQTAQHPRQIWGAPPGTVCCQGFTVDPSSSPVGFAGQGLDPAPVAGSHLGVEQKHARSST